jgi:predicted membrane-bound mannosyltransferase
MIRERNPVAIPVPKVSRDQNNTAKATASRVPYLRIQSAPGICIAAYANENALVIIPIWTGVKCRSPRMVVVLTEMFARSMLQMNVIKKTRLNPTHLAFVGRTTAGEGAVAICAAVIYHSCLFFRPS